MKAFALVNRFGTIDHRTIEMSSTGAKQHLIDTKGDDDRFHQWAWWKSKGWRVHPVTITIDPVIIATDQPEKELTL